MKSKLAASLGIDKNKKLSPAKVQEGDAELALWIEKNAYG